MASHHIDISEYEKDPRLFLFTSLTAGSSHIITATSRMETILKANKISFQAIDLATDEKARRLWQRRARERKLPGLVKDGFVLGDLDEIEEWNEFGELKENIGNVPSSNDSGSNTVKTGVNIAPPIPVNPTATSGTTNISQPAVSKAPATSADENKRVALPGAAEIAARYKPTPEQKDGKSVIDENAPPKATETMSSAPAEKEESINAAKRLLKEEQTQGVEHLSAPPSAMQSGTATPDPEPAEKLATSSGNGEEGGKLTHGGSEVKDAPVDEVKKVESENSLAEAAEEEAGGEKKAKAEAEKPEASAAVEASDAGEGKVAEKVKEQSAKDPEDAGKSVGD